MSNSRPSSLVEKFRHQRIADRITLEFEKVKATVNHEPKPDDCKRGFLIYVGNRHDEPEAA